MPVVASEFSFQCLHVLPPTSCLPVLGNFRLSSTFLSILYFHLFVYVTITRCHSQVIIMLASMLRCTGFKCWLFCGNKMPTRCNRGFYYRSYCLLNMFWASLCPSSGAQEYYTVVAVCLPASCKPDA